MWIGNLPGFPSGFQLDGQITYMNMWDKLIPKASIQSLANSCGTETGNVLHWSFLPAFSQGDVQYSAYSSIAPKGMKLQVRCHSGVYVFYSDCAKTKT